MSALHEDQYTFMIARSFLLRMSNVAEKVVHKIKSHILYLIVFFFFENPAVYEIMWKNVVEPDRPLMTNMAHAHCMLDN
jgi:hypothetical protein